MPGVIHSEPETTDARCLVSNRASAFSVYGAGEGIRTLDVNLGKVALYH